MPFWNIFGRPDRQMQSGDSPSTDVVDVDVPKAIDTLVPPFGRRLTALPDEVGRLGISIVAQSERGSPCDVDIVCIHGLGGHPYSTWVSERGGFFWPSRVTKDIPNSRVMTFGYDNRLASLIDRLEDSARNLLQDLSRERKDQDARRRPIIFVAHSLGGLLVKETISLAKKDHTPTHLRETGACTAGIMFLGTPHWGHDRRPSQEDIEGILLAAGYPRQVETATISRLASNNDGFCRLLSESGSQGSPIHVQTFFEEHPSPGIGIVVQKKLATGNGEFLTESFCTDHMGLAKCSSPSDHKYKAMVGTLETWLDEIKPATPKSSNKIAEGNAARFQEGESSRTPPEQQRRPTIATPGTFNSNGGKLFTNIQNRDQSRVHLGDVHHRDTYQIDAKSNDRPGVHLASTSLLTGTETRCIGGRKTRSLGVE